MISRVDLLNVRAIIAKGTQQEALQAIDILIRDRPIVESGFVASVLTQPIRHPKSQRFHEILHELGDLHDKKQRDYGNNDDPFANVTASKDWGIEPHVGALLRMNDKVQRLKQWIQTGTLANEGAHDSMRDIAVYAIIALVLDEWDDAVEPINKVVPANI